MIVRGESTIIDYHAPFDQGFNKPTITNYHSHGQTVMIVDDSSPAVARAKSREQRVPSFFREKMRILNGVP